MILKMKMIRISKRFWKRCVIDLPVSCGLKVCLIQKSLVDAKGVGRCTYCH